MRKSLARRETTDLRARLERLPRELLNGRWTHCTITAVDQQVWFREPSADVERRRQLALRRRGLLALGAVTLLLLATILPANAAALTAVLGSALLLSALDGLRRDQRFEVQQHEFAMIDGRRDEVRLRRPDGPTMTIAVADLKAFVVLVEPDGELFHLSPVLRLETGEELFVPWMHTTSDTAAVALCWLFGYLTGRPSARLDATFPLPPDALAQAERLAGPFGAEGWTPPQL